MSAILPGRAEGKVTLAEMASRRIGASNRASETFFRDNADRVARACHAMALRFREGARLLVGADASRQSDVAHVVVEFVHPVIVGKRALPAVALPAIRNSAETASALDVLARKPDILMVIHSGTLNLRLEDILVRAHERGLLTVLLGSVSATSVVSQADVEFSVPSHDPCIVQEVHEMLYHVLWELVHVFLEHRAIT